MKLLPSRRSDRRPLPGHRWRASLWQSLPFFLIFAVPAAVAYFTSGDGWLEKCKAQHWFLGFLNLNCWEFRWELVLVAGIGSFATVMLAWWLLRGLAGLRSMFETPWFGVGEEAETTGTLESLLRATLFVMALWLCLGIGALAVLGLKVALSTANDPFATPGPPASPGAPNTPTASGPDWNKLDSTLGYLLEETRTLNVVLKNQPTRDKNGQVPAFDRIGAELQELNTTTTNTSNFLAGIDQHITESRNQQITVLTSIKNALNNPQTNAGSNPPSPAPSPAQDMSLGCFEVSGRGRFRIVASCPIFFDTSSPHLSDKGRAELENFLENRARKGLSLWIHASADGQGPPGVNRRLARKRAQAVAATIPSLGLAFAPQIIRQTSAPEDGARTSEPNNRVAKVRLLEQCQ